MENRYLLIDQKLQIKIEHGKLWVENELYSTLVGCPKGIQTLEWSLEKWKEVSNLYLSINKGAIINEGTSVFVGYTAEIESLDDVNNPYEAMRGKHLGVKHIVCAYRLPGRNHTRYPKQQ